MCISDYDTADDCFDRVKCNDEPLLFLANSVFEVCTSTIRSKLFIKDAVKLTVTCKGFQESHVCGLVPPS